MLTEAADYDTLFRDFRWDIPARFNMATACCDRHADGNNRTALIYVDEEGSAQRTSFDELRAMSCRFANVLKADGLARGDRVAVFLSQSLELPIVHLAAFRAGLVSVPLFTLFGEDALEFRLANSGARAVVTDETGWEKLAKIRDRLPYLQDIYVTSGAIHAGAKSFWAAIEDAAEEFETVATSADDPAIIIYTSGTTGNPKGALHAARPSALCRDGARFPAQTRRRDVDAGGLGLDRRVVQRVARVVVSRRAGSRASRAEVRAASRDAADGRSRRA
jgi:acetyl-CoA synthetase